MQTHDQLGQREARVSPADAPTPPTSRRWTAELAVGILGAVTGLGTAMMFLG